MHVPKSAGSSLRASLENALGPGAIAPKLQDTGLLCGFTDLHRLDPATRTVLAVEPDEVSSLADYAVVTGHFLLSTLRRIAPPTSIATVLREPRARLLSNFAFWRLSPALRHTWRGYPPLDRAWSSLGEFLADPDVAQATDNLLCRMLLSADSRIPEFDFLTDPQAVAADAIAVLGTLGFVGIVELPHDMWQGLSSFFDAPLTPVVINSTSDQSVGSDAPAIEEEITAHTLSLIRARTAADAIVYKHAAREAGLSLSAGRQLAEAAFANELMRVGDLAGRSATESRDRARTIEQLNLQLDVQARKHSDLLGQTQHDLQDTQRDLQHTQQELQHAQQDVQETQEQLQHTQEDLQQARHALKGARDELARHRGWLQGIQDSVSWRITAPARAAKRALIGWRGPRSRQARDGGQRSR